LAKVKSGGLAWIALVAAAAGAIVLMVVQLDDDGASPDSTTFGLFVVAAALGFAALAPGIAVRGLRRVSQFKVGGLELGLAEIKRADRVRPPLEEDGVRSERRPKSSGYDACVARLRNRMNRARATLGLSARKDDYVGIAEEFRSLGLLTRDEETFVVDLQDYDPLSNDWSTATAEKFLDDTWEFATRFRALVWDRQVRKSLKEQRWSIFEFEQSQGHRPDFLAYRDGDWALLAARVGSISKNKPDKLDVAARRLWRFREGPEIASRSILLPELSGGFLSDALDVEVSAGIRVVTLAEFLAA
jgi:hypothetical protein